MIKLGISLIQECLRTDFSCCDERQFTIDLCRLRLDMGEWEA